MQKPLLVRPLTDAERASLEVGLRSSDAFRLRLCQILLASARGERVPPIARHLGCAEQSVRNAIHAFHARGLASVTRGATTAHTIHRAFAVPAAEQLRVLLHQSPRAFGHPTSLWTLELAAEVSFDQGLTATRITGETIRVTLARLGVRWQRAKHWLTSPDPEYARKKGRAIA